MNHHTLGVILLAVFTGLLGAVVGGLSRVVQDWWQRRLARKVAARLLYADLEVAYGYFDKLQRNALLVHDAHLDRHLKVWAEQSGAFAGAVRAGDFHLVAGAFTGLNTYVSMIETAEPDDTLILQMVENLDRARRIAWQAGGTPLDQALKTSAYVDGPGSDTYRLLPPGMREG